VSSIHLRGYALVDWPGCNGERGAAISEQPRVGCEKPDETGRLLISSSPPRLPPNYDRHAACHPTPMNAVGNKPDDELPPPPPPPPPKILEEKSELPPVPLDANGLTPHSLDPNGPRLSFFLPSCATVESLFFALVLLTTPMTPTSPGGSPSHASSPLPEARSKKTNPLMELVETEKAYVDQLAGIIRVTSTDDL